MDEASAFVANNPEELGPDCLPTYGGRSMRVKKNVDHAGVVLTHSKKDFALARTALSVTPGRFRPMPLPVETTWA
jgi:hypothetical protein